MEIHIKIIGFILLPLGMIHIIFPRFFNWKKELSTLTLINRQMMQVHTFFIALIVILMGILCLTGSSDLVTTKLGKSICLGMGIFWGVRALFQFFVYSPKLWRGKTFETFIHIIFSFIWIYFTTVFIRIAWD